MKREFQISYKKEILRFALLLGEQMLTNGAETSRVEDSVLRVCKSRGFKHVNVFTTPTCVIISDEKFDGLTFMKTISKRTINLTKIDRLNDISREFVQNEDVDPLQAIDKLKEVEAVKDYNQFIYFAGTAMASASFAYLIGGTTVLDFILTLIIASIGVIIYNKIMKLNGITFFATLMSSFSIAVLGNLLVNYNVLQNSTSLIVGSIMPLLPGVSFIKGLRDLISGNLLAGISRIIEAFLIAAAIAVGVGVVLDLTHRFGG
ncbi:threonine/serine ThrE exporter family protein [Terrisporobacter sp.]|uniref:threonine/serine ThrE exporter family protein n=1 Tax=Terrisporobacter sp. TaxID=1965305 RepID=UPI0026242E5A|nr:threonine/serine exporter family protein [Terrisporobacter sp.]